MKKFKLFILSAALVIASMAALTGCSSSSSAEDGPHAVAVIIGNHASSQKLNFASPMVEQTIQDCIELYGFVSVINEDGVPELIAANTYDIADQYKNASPERLETDARLKTTSILAEMQEVIADDPEVDVLSAIHLAVESFAALDESYTSRTILILDTGLSTTGVLDFRNNLLFGGPENIADLLEEKDEIPDLDGITVVWQQLGDVADPQSLTRNQTELLKEIWQAIVERGGGTFVCSDIPANPDTGDDDGSYPDVSVVELPAEDPIVFDSAQLSEETVPETIPVSKTEAPEPEDTVELHPQILTEEQICFIPDSSEYLDQDAAIATITPIADYLNEHSDVTILLAGSVAGDDNSKYGYTLSQQRADAVKNSLVSLGVSGNRIQTKGLGVSSPWHIYGVGYEGPLASQNRQVILMDANSDLAQETLSQ